VTPRSASAGIVDLRSALLALRPAAFSSAGDGDDGDEEGAPSGAPSPPADDGADGGTDDGGTDDNGSENVQDPERQRLSREAAKYRTAAKAERERADAAEARTTSLEELVSGLVAQNAFLRAAGGTIGDVDAAWKLADHDSVRVNDDGTVDGIDEALAQVTERYPYLTKGPSDVDPILVGKFPALAPSGRVTNAKRKTDGGSLSAAVLAAKYPALGLHR
jgi:hypothetical protein